MGAPTHIFDADKIAGGLDVRWAKKGESLKLLNGNTVALDETVGVIADSKEVESLAGMGGDATAVTDAAKHLYRSRLLVAGCGGRALAPLQFFDRCRAPCLSVAWTHRSPWRISSALRNWSPIFAARLIQIGPVDDQQPNMPQRPPVQLRVARAAKIIGMEVNEAQCLDVFKRLGLPATSDGKGDQAAAHRHAAAAPRLDD